MNINVSVIMPSLNVASYIEESVRSVMKQTLVNIEIICVDAGSNDGTLQILNMLSGEDSRVIVINSDRRSYGYQVNLGIRIARGEYVAVVETDDYVSENYCLDLYTLGKRENADIVKSDYYAYYTLNNGERFFLNRTTSSDDSLYGNVFSGLDHARIAEDDWYLWTGIYKKDFLIGEDIWFHESAGAAFQDIGFLHKTNTKAKRIVYTKNKYYHYCIDRETSSSNNGKGLLYSYNEFKSLLDDTDQDSDCNELKQLYLRMTKSLVCCLNGISTLESFRDFEYIDAYNWMSLQICKSFDQGIISKKDMSKGLLKVFDYLLKPLDALLDYKTKLYDGLEKLIGDNKTIIFGCGNIGYEAYRWMISKNRKPVAFMDNNPELHGKAINDIPIVSPKECDRFDDCVFIVANEKYSKSIEQQLSEAGIHSDRIVSFGF